jgi:enoyl-[acyl-carrier protein] reductase I
VQDLIAELDADIPLLMCDVTSDEQMDATFRWIKDHWDSLDLLLHSVAFAPPAALEGQFLDTSREAFRIAHDVSVYSLVDAARRAAPLMTKGGSIVTLTYYGSTKVIPRYNVMGAAKASLEASVRYLANDLGPQNVRVNAISAGPVDTLSARAIPGFTQMLKHHESRAPLRRNVKADELAATALFLASPASSAITGQVLYADCGYETMGV